MASIDLYTKQQIDAKIPDTSGASSGDVLTFNGSANVWAAASGGGKTPTILAAAPTMSDLFNVSMEGSEWIAVVKDDFDIIVACGSDPCTYGKMSFKKDERYTLGDNSVDQTVLGMCMVARDTFACLNSDPDNSLFGVYSATIGGSSYSSNAHTYSTARPANNTAKTYYVIKYT